MLWPVAEGIKASTGLRQRMSNLPGQQGDGAEDPAQCKSCWDAFSWPPWWMWPCFPGSLSSSTLTLHIPACLTWGWAVPERSLKCIFLTPSYKSSAIQSFPWAGIGQPLIPSTWQFLLCSSPVFIIVLPNCEDEKQLIYSNYSNISSSVQGLVSGRTCRDVAVGQCLYLVLSDFILL